MNKQSILFFGFGYTASISAIQLYQLGYKIYGTKRNLSLNNQEPNQGGEFKNYNLVSFTDFDRLSEIIGHVSHIIISIPPVEGIADLVLELYGKQIADCAKNLISIIYLSSTGVYGNHDGNWVDEETKPIPNTQRTILRLDSENAWQVFADRYRIKLKILRLAGIYGPFRNALYSIKRSVTNSIYKEGLVFSRIHVEDIANFIKIIILEPEQEIPDGIFNLADDLPAASYKVNNYAAQILQVPEPVLVPFDQAKLSPMAMEFYTSNKRVRNSKMKRCLTNGLIYPNYMIGLRALYQNNQY